MVAMNIVQCTCKEKPTLLCVRKFHIRLGTATMRNSDKPLNYFIEKFGCRTSSLDLLMIHVIMWLFMYAGIIRTNSFTWSLLHSRRITSWNSDSIISQKESELHSIIEKSEKESSWLGKSLSDLCQPWNLHINSRPVPINGSSFSYQLIAPWLFCWFSLSQQTAVRSVCSNKCTMQHNNQL